MIAAAPEYRPASGLDYLPSDVVRRIDHARDLRADALDAIRCLQVHENLAHPRQWIAVLAGAKVAVDGLIAAYGIARNRLVAESVGAHLVDDAVTALRVVHAEHEMALRSYERQARHASVIPHDSVICDAAEWLESAPQGAQCRGGIGTSLAHAAQWTDSRSGQHVCTVLAAHGARTAAAGSAAELSDAPRGAGLRPVQSFPRES